MLLLEFHVRTKIEFGASTRITISVAPAGIQFIRAFRNSRPRGNDEMPGRHIFLTPLNTYSGLRPASCTSLPMRAMSSRRSFANSPGVLPTMSPP